MGAQRSHIRKKILLVDDDAVTLEIMSLYLKEFYTVFTVTTGTEALRFLSTHSIDLILLDYMMPEMDGPTVFVNIRKKFPGLQIPIVFLTGVADKDLVIRGLNLNPMDYLLKPVSQTDLIERVQRVLLGV